MGLLADGQTWLRTQRAGQARAIVYRRGAGSVNIDAVQARTTAATEANEVFVDANFVDWLIERADLVIAAVPMEPQQGDRIEVTYEHGAEVFVVSTLGNEPCQRWHGQDGGTFRVHTVRV